MSDPLNVTCPKCSAKPGEKCKTPSGTDAYNIHSARTNPWLHEEIRTKTGKVLTDADIEALADEAEAGYDVTPLLDDAALPFDDDFTDDLATELDGWREIADELAAVLSQHGAIGTMNPGRKRALARYRKAKGR